MDHKLDIDALARRLKKLRKDRGWTLRQAALNTHVSHNQIALLEAGTTPNPTVTSLQKIADGYKVPLAEIISQDELTVIQVQEKGMQANAELGGGDVNLLAIKELDLEEYELILRQLAERRAKLERERKEARNAKRRKQKPAGSSGQTDSEAQIT